MNLKPFTFRRSRWLVQGVGRVTASDQKEVLEKYLEQFHKDRQCYTTIWLCRPEANFTFEEAHVEDRYCLNLEYWILNKFLITDILKEAQFYDNRVQKIVFKK